VAGFPLPKHLRLYVILLFWFIVISALRKKSIIELRKRFTRHCSRNTKILRFVELEVFFSNSPSERKVIYDLGRER
jgi:hypothetical protein